MKTFEPYIEERLEDLEININSPILEKYIKIFLNKGSAFGSNHSTTQLAIKGITSLPANLSSALDIGCGSGILTILLLKLNYKEVLSIDVDPFALNEAKKNMISNFKKVPQNVILSEDEINEINQKFSLVVANISLNFIYNNFNTIVSLVMNKGYLVISGFNHKDKEKYVNLASKNDMHLVSEFQEKPWISLVFRKLSF